MKINNGFIKFGELRTVEVYDTIEKVAALSDDWAKSVKQGDEFCKGSECPFLPGANFEYDLKNFLYYRARAITSDIPNQNGDLFPHSEIKSAYNTFVGKGIYFNHDSDIPEKAFGVILDAAYTPVLFNNDKYEDKYVEILGAIHRNAVRERHPGLLEDIECGKVTATSMGTLAKMAQCSICGNKATNVYELCPHCNPMNPMYSKGRNVYGKMCFETNYDLHFVEDSIVYVPADPTAYMLEVYAGKKNLEQHKYFEELSGLFSKYSLKKGRKNISPLQITTKASTTGGLIMAADKERAPEQPDYQKDAGEISEDIGNSTEKILDTKMRRIIEEELRKVLAPALELLDKNMRPKIQDAVAQEAEKAKSEVSKAIEAPMDAAAATPDMPAPDLEASPEAAEGEVPAAPVASNKKPIVFTEAFASWTPENKKKLIDAIGSGKPWSFDGYLEVPKSEDK